MLKNINFRKVVYVFILTCLSLHVVMIDIERVIIHDVSSWLYRFFLEFYQSLNPLNYNIVFLSFFMFYFYYHVYFDGQKINKWNVLLSIVFTICTIMGKCYSTLSSSLGILFFSTVQVYKLFILFIAYYIIYYAIIKKISRLHFFNIKMKKTFLEKTFGNHPILFTFFVIFLFWLPYIVCYYPGGATGDTADSVYQFFHDDNSWTIQTIQLTDSDVYINKHHSVLFTVTFGMFIKVGNLLSSYNLGFYFYVLFQVFILISIFTFMFYYMKKMKVPFVFIICSLLFISLSPLIIKYSITAVKDTLNAIFTLLYVIFLFQIVRNYKSIFKNKFRLLIFIITMLLVMMLRNNGIYTIVFSFPFLLLLYKEKRKYLGKVFLSVLLIFCLYDQILLPSLGVSNGSIKEMLSVPFMQIARTAKYHLDDFTDSEKETINKVLDFHNITSNYNPKIADDVKDTYKRTVTKEELYDFFKVWFRYLKKYPFVYLDSFLNSTYGYFYPPFIEDNPKILFSNFLAYQGEFNLGQINFFNDARATLNYWLCIVYHSPFTIFFNNVALIVWVLLFSFLYIIRKKQYRYLIPFSPFISILVICLFSPVNGCARYVLPIIFSIPFILFIDYFVYCNTKE